MSGDEQLADAGRIHERHISQIENDRPPTVGDHCLQRVGEPRNGRGVDLARHGHPDPIRLVDAADLDIRLYHVIDSQFPTPTRSPQPQPVLVPTRPRCWSTTSLSPVRRQQTQPTQAGRRRSRSSVVRRRGQPRGRRLRASGTQGAGPVGARRPRAATTSDDIRRRTEYSITTSTTRSTCRTCRARDGAAPRSRERT
jgi:hypothetical protein